MTADFTYHVSDNLPPMDFLVARRGDTVDLTGASGSVYIRPSGGSANVISGSGQVVVAASGLFRFNISAAALGSAGFSTPGNYLGQLFVSWASGHETIQEDFSILVRRTFRTQ